MLRHRSLGTLAAFVAAAALTLDAQSASQTRRLRANGADLSYVDEGKGAPIVFVHGAVADLRFWEPQREAIAKQHRFVAYTFRYHGTAPWTDEGKQYSAATHAADLAAFIGALKSGPVHLVGLSYGGLLAALVAVKQPQLLRTLTLAEPALFGVLADLPEGKPALEAWTTGATPMFAAMKKGDAVQATKLLAALVDGVPAENADTHFDKLPQALRQSLLDNARTLPLLFQAPPETVSCDALRAVKVPTLLIRGAHTPLIFSKTNEVVSRCIAGSESVAVPDATHAMSYQNPAAFNQTVLRFVQKHRGTN
jgi:pimeloyl-ACP methyl ester carboxylesterase